jgi:nitrogen fixation/metabolism regulation signal transduction histidine kinase
MMYQRRIVVTALAAFVPSAIAVLLFAWSGGVSQRAQWTATLVVAAGFVILLLILPDVIEYPLRTLSNLVTALREEDYSLRARNVRRDDPVGDILLELNALADVMESRKLEALEAAALLRAVLAEIDVAIFAFDANSRLRLVNRAGERLLGVPRERALGSAATEIGVADLLEQRMFPGAPAGRWDIRHSVFRERGESLTLVVVADITRALREEEAEAWRRIVRVIGHELNNSLAPIRSISTSIEQLVTRDPLPDDWQHDLMRGMRVISSRTEALTRFTRAYAQLARLPEPRKRPVALGDLVRRVAALETRVPIELAGDPTLIVSADEDQLEQLLINIVRNAAEASLDTAGRVHIEWHARRGATELLVFDEGAGLGGTANLFVPFFTTKSGGTGIGLVLSRQIAEAHGGTLTLENRPHTRGAVARLTLPT